MASIVLSYQSQQGANPIYTVTFKLFGNQDLPRSFSGESSISSSASGSSIMTGPAYSQKKIWAIEAYMTPSEAEVVYNLFESWDSDRALGLPVACSIEDNTLFSQVVSSVVISTPPSFSEAGPAYFYVNIGLTEV